MGTNSMTSEGEQQEEPLRLTIRVPEGLWWEVDGAARKSRRTRGVTKEEWCAEAFRHYLDHLAETDDGEVAAETDDGEVVMESGTVPDDVFAVLVKGQAVLAKQQEEQGKQLGAILLTLAEAINMLEDRS